MSEIPFIKAEYGMIANRHGGIDILLIKAVNSYCLKRMVKKLDKRERT